MTFAVPRGKSARSIVDANRRLNLWWGSVRSTKTVSSVVAWLNYVDSAAPPGDLYMIGRTERTLERNVINPLKELLGKDGIGHNRARGELSILGRRHYIVGASSEAAVERIQGATSAGNYGDEVSTWPDSVWKMQLSRMSVAGARGYYTTNPDSPYHYLKTDVLDRAHELDLVDFHFTLADNPFLTAAYVNALKAEYGGPGTLWYRRFIDGLWVLAEGAVYDMWTDRHVVTALPPKSDVAQAWLGIDYGTKAPFVALLILHVRQPFDHLLVAREWRWDSEARRHQMTDKEYADALGAWLLDEVPGLINGTVVGARKGERASSLLSAIVVDPSAASFIRQLYSDRFQRLWGANNAVIDGIRNTASLLGATPPRLLVHESCDGLIREMGGYSWDEKRQKKGEDVPLKRADHGPDALRYLVQATSRVWRPWIVGQVPVAA